MMNKFNCGIPNADIKLSELSLPEDLKRLTPEQCLKLCGEIRRILITTVSKNGGHLASNLGTVELTMAIHRVFDSPNDKIVWDVGHQAYTHKILTGRLSQFNSLRKENGLSGFPNPSESPHDAFISGHSSTSVSVACAIAESMRLKGNDKNYAVAVVGDGAMTGGMFYEGLNNGGKEKNNLIVILNHNNMSISKNVGGLSKYLSKIRSRESYVKTKSALEKVLGKTPVIGMPIVRALKTSKDIVKNAIYHSTMFDDLGFVYLGPVDGHDLSELEAVLYTAKAYKHPVFVHVNTIKGKGYIPAEKNPGEYHGISKFDIATGNPEISAAECFSTVFGQELHQLALQDSKICAVTAAMKYATGLQFFYADFKDRFFDVGIAEQHAVTFCAGLASMGFIPVFAVYSSFLQRSYDQIIHDAAISSLHIVLCVDRAGLTGEDGETHQGIFDVPMLASIPNTTIYSPSNYQQLRACLYNALYEDNGIVCVRYPKGKEYPQSIKYQHANPNANNEYYLETYDNSKILIISYGRILNNIINASKILNDGCIYADLLSLVKIFPLNDDCFNNITRYDYIFFFEESLESGGIAEHFALKLMQYGFKGSYHIKAVKGFVKHASADRQIQLCGFDENSIAEFIKNTISLQKD